MDSFPKPGLLDTAFASQIVGLHALVDGCSTGFEVQQEVRVRHFDACPLRNLRVA